MAVYPLNSIPSMTERIYITPAGKLKLHEELNRLKGKERPATVVEVEDARAHGDLSENAEYHAAREKLAIINARINDLENRLARLEVIDVSHINTSKVVFGTKVTLVNLESGGEITYRIVGDFEADPGNNEISINSPIARALIGKAVGDEVAVNTPGGRREFSVERIDR